MNDLTATIDNALQAGVASYAISQGQSVNNVTTSPAQAASNSMMWLFAIIVIGALAFFAIKKG